MAMPGCEVLAYNGNLGRVLRVQSEIVEEGYVCGGCAWYCDSAVAALMFKNIVGAQGARNLLVVVDSRGAIYRWVAESALSVQKGKRRVSAPRNLRVAINRIGLRLERGGIVDGGEVASLILETVFERLGVGIVARNLVVIVNSEGDCTSCAGVIETGVSTALVEKPVTPQLINIIAHDVAGIVDAKSERLRGVWEIDGCEASVSIQETAVRPGRVEVIARDLT